MGRRGLENEPTAFLGAGGMASNSAEVIQQGWGATARARNQSSRIFRGNVFKYSDALLRCLSIIFPKQLYVLFFQSCSRMRSRGHTTVASATAQFSSRLPPLIRKDSSIFRPSRRRDNLESNSSGHPMIVTPK
jgi:hypothetical protein